MLDQIKKSMYWYGNYWSQQRWKHQFILDQITMRTWLRTETSTSKSSRRFRHPAENGLESGLRDSECFPRLNRHFLHGWDPLWIWQSKQVDATKSTRLLRFSFVSGKMYEHPETNVRRKEQLQYFQQSSEYKNYSETMENPMNSSGIFSKDSQYCRFSQRFKRKACQTCPEKFENRIIFMFMFNHIDWTEANLKNVFRISTKSRITQKKRFPRGHGSFLGSGTEDKWDGTHNPDPEGEWNTTVDVMGEIFQRKRTSSTPSYQCVESRSLERERWKIYDSLHCGIFEYRALISHESPSKSLPYLRSSSELMWRIDSADFWSNAFEHEEICYEGEQSVISKTGTARSALLCTDLNEEWSSSDRPTTYSSTKIWRTVERYQKSQKLTNAARFMRRVSIEMYYTTIHNVNDGFRGRTGTYKEYSLPREDPDFEIIVWIDGHTKIGPVFQVKTTFRFDLYEMVANFSSDRKPHAIVSSFEETRATQPKAQSNLMSSHPEDFLPIDERKWNDIPAYDVVRGNTLEYRNSKWIMRLARHLERTDWETDNTVHWQSMDPKLRHAFHGEDGRPSLIQTDLIISTKEQLNSISILQ